MRVLASSIAVVVGIACAGTGVLRQPLPSRVLSTPGVVPSAPVSCEGEAGRLARLGARLFREPLLSGDGSMACVSCHDPAQDFSDGLSLGRGIGGAELPRNTPGLVNVGYVQSLFWDGRAPSLEAQAVAVLASPLEMASSAEGAAGRLRNIPAYREAFRRALPERALDGEAVVAALVAFERSIAGRRSPFDFHLLGSSDALSPAASRGLALFEGKASCNQCHHGALLTDGRFHNTGVITEDPGRIAVVRNTEARISPYPFFANYKAFRTPTLRNLARTAPYFHNGSAATLQDVVRFYNQGGLASDRYGRSPKVRPLGLQEGEITDLVAFLESLTSPVDACPPLEMDPVPASSQP